MGESKEIKEPSMSIGERLYCLEQDIEEYIQHNGLEADKELDFILKQVIEIKEIIQKEM